ncbi:MAG: hypothetical protein LBL76_00415 [Treponema sp.]|jgi:predicted transposase/invertase (TIGR01784 family)|nr:hypothetical protein [Treponema sp.]
MSEYKYVVDTQSKVVQAKREGLQKGIKKVALNLKAIGMPIGQIVQATGLTEQQINKL